MDAYEYAAGFKGMKRKQLDGTDFLKSYKGMEDAIDYVRKHRAPILVHAEVPLLGHHTSGVRKEWYRSADDLDKHEKKTFPQAEAGHVGRRILGRRTYTVRSEAEAKVKADFEAAIAAEIPSDESLFLHEFAPTPLPKKWKSASAGAKRW